jgi:hypothetical protein
MTMAEVKTGLCEGCKDFKPIAYTDPVNREYCAGCFAVLPVPTVGRIVEYLIHTIPFMEGDVVECRTAGRLYDGIGVIDEVSIEPEKFGTPVYPSFHVQIKEKAYPEAPDELWYMETQLKRVEDDVTIKKYSSPEDPKRGDEDDDEVSQDQSHPLDTPGEEWNDTPNYPEV